MKRSALIMIFPIILTACTGGDIPPKLEGKTSAEKKEILVNECEAEAYLGHDSGHHHHNYYKPENQSHLKNMVSICKALAEPSADKNVLIPQCKKEAQNKANYRGEESLKIHIGRLTTICNEFSKI